MIKTDLAILLGITGDLAFAAGCLIQALRRHSPDLNPDILIYSDGQIPRDDATLLRESGASILPYSPPEGSIDPSYLARFSLLALARFEGFRLLEQYKTVVYLDVDIAVQDDITPLLAFGPLGLTLEDSCLLFSGQPTRAGINSTESIPGFDPEARNINSGVIVFQDTLPDPMGLYQLCMDWLRMYGKRFSNLDQGIINFLAQRLSRSHEQLVSLIPEDRFNALPANPRAQDAVLVHSVGGSKFWNDALLNMFFPEWKRDYTRWLAKGGSPWKGEVRNENLLQEGPYKMLQILYDRLEP